MNSGYRTVFAVAITAMAFQSTASADDQPAAMDQKQKVSYSIGMNIANSIKRAGVEVDADVVTAAMKDVLTGRELKLTEQQAQETWQSYQQEQAAKRNEQRLKLAEKNRKAGEDFLAANKQKAGVKTHDVKLPDGAAAQLQYKIIAEGTGNSPSATDTAVINLKGTLIDGKEFENHPNRKSPINRYPSRALVEILPMMKPGAKWEVYVPANLAYGDRGNGTTVEPGSALIYEVELVNIETPQPMTSDIIMVPSAEQMKAGSNIVVIKPEDAAKYAQTNSAPSSQKKP